MPKEWIKLIKLENGYTYAEVKKKRDYWGIGKCNPDTITFKPNLVRRGFFNDDA